LNNSDETVFKDLLNLQESNQLDKVFKLTDQFVEKYAESVSTSQLRNVYNEVVKIQSVEDLKLIRPHLAYVAARQDKNNAREFIAFIDLLIQQVNTKNELESFKKTMEAIVAYHKYYAKN
jgi:CRISPR-associated protein Csm2